MNKMITKIAVAGTVVLILIGSIMSIKETRSGPPASTATESFAMSHQDVLSQLLQERGVVACMEPGTRQEIVSYAKAKRHFDKVVHEVHSRDMTREILPFLQDPHQTIRIRAVQALGRLENPEAEAPLQALGPYAVPPVLRQLAVARIRSRQLKGAARLAAVVQSVGLTVPDLARLSRKVNAPSERTWMRGTQGDIMMQEFVDLLYAMGKKGERVRPLVSPLTLNLEQEAIIEGASLPLDKEITLIFRLFEKFISVASSDNELVEHLLDLGPHATDRIVQLLADMQGHPQQYRWLSVEAFASLFDIAAQTDDPRVLPLLKKFEKSPKPWPLIAMFAGQSIKPVEREMRWEKIEAKVGAMPQSHSTGITLHE